jgi:serine phosphatase RsbU (regulator of sigma subunit)
MSQSRELTAEAKYRLLMQMAQRVSGTFDLDEILGHLLDTVAAVLQYDAAGVFVLDRTNVAPPAGRAGQFIAGMSARGFDPRPPETDPMLRLGKGIVGHVIRTGVPVIAPDVGREPHYVQGRAGTRSEIAVPIVVSGEPVGALNLESDRLGAYDETDLEALRFFADAAAISIDKAMLHRQVMERSWVESQLRLAHEIQSRLLPAAPPQAPGYDLAGTSLSAYDVGGDYYDYIPLSRDRLAVVVADVAGKGIPAALMMATFRALLRTHLHIDQDLLELIDAVNRSLVESVGLPAFVTCVCGLLDLPTGRFAYANCGHNPPLIVRAGGEAEELAAGGHFLGAFEDARPEIGEAALASGDALLLYTDGVVDASPGGDDEFGVDRIASTVARARHRPAAAVVDAVVEATRAFSGTSAYRDDFTLVVVKRNE